MNAQNTKCCPHYQIYSEVLKMEGPPAYLAIRRCMLTERLIRFLDTSEEGRQLSEKMVIHTQEDRKYAFVGPDLDAVTQQVCSVQRCESHCTPAYLQILQNFDIEDPNEEKVTCSDEASEEKNPEPEWVQTCTPG